jgi:ATP-dependent Clp protease ATP-binding subunit ClpC
MKLTPAAEAAWMIAAGEAAASGHERIEPGHLLVGVLSLAKLGPQADVAGLGLDAELVRREHARLVEALQPLGLDGTRLRRRARAQLGRGPATGPPPAPLSRSLACKALFAAAQAFAGRGEIGIGHLFAALAEGVDALTAQVIHGSGVDASALRAAGLEAALEAAADAGTGPWPKALGSQRRGAPTPFLDRCGRDLTALAARGELSPVVARRDEILAVLRCLSRGATSPVLVGERGVGRTAIVEALAIRAAQGEDLALLGGRRIVELSAAALLAGAPDPEERLAALVQEARSHPEVLLFVQGVGLLDAFAFRAALVNGQLRCIAATSAEQLRDLQERDPELALRLESVSVEEPRRDDALAMLRARRGALEARQGVTIPEATLAAALDLSVRFDLEGRLPAKALELLEDAAALAHLPLRGLAAPAGGEPDDGPLVTPECVARVLSDKRGLSLELVAQSFLSTALREELPVVIARALDAFAAEAGRQHGVRLRVAPEVVRFAVDWAEQAGAGPGDARRTAERLLEVPVEALVRAGKLARHAAWVAVYDEGGVYVIPEA